jgi:VWFA-related protein
MAEEGELMNRRILCAVLVLLLAVSVSGGQEPVIEERVEVRLVYVETVVTDSKGNTVPDLSQDDFLLSVGGQNHEIEVFDANCKGGALAEPEKNEKDTWRDPVAGPQVPRRIVLVFDYEHLPNVDRSSVLDYARYMLAKGKTPGEQVMIVALANGVRVEQRFTSDPRRLDETLQRMKYDLTLWALDFGGGVSGRTYFDQLATLMDVLDQYDGPKGVVMFSEWMGRSNTDDLWFFDVAHHAAAARAAIYPVFSAGLQTGVPAGGPPGLARLANESGGRLTFRTNDLSLGYARAQRDMSCRYGIGFYIDEGVSRPQRVSVRVTRSGLQTRSPEQVKFFTDKERLENRLRAAIVDPGNFENPYVRSHAYAAGPASKKAWDTLLALHFRMKVDPEGSELDVVATLDEGVTKVAQMRERFHIKATADGSPQPVTVYGVRKLDPGIHTLTIVVNKAGSEIPQTTRLEFAIPNVPDDDVILRGPILAKALRSGVLIRTKEASAEARAALRDLIGDDGSFQPLLIHQIEPSDTLLAGWKACSLKKKAGEGAVAERRVVNKQGEVVHTLEPVTLELTGKKVRCQEKLDAISGEDLGPGEYRVEVTVKSASGKILASGLAPLRVREAG